MAWPKGVPRAPKDKPRGGSRKGRPNKSTIVREALRNKAAALGISPLEVMLETMRKCYDAGDLKGAHEAAKDAAPYLHPRLNSINATVDQHTTIAIEDRESTEWLIAQLDRLEAAEEVARRADRDPLKGNGATTH